MVNEARRRKNRIRRNQNRTESFIPNFGKPISAERKKDQRTVLPLLWWLISEGLAVTNKQRNEFSRAWNLVLLTFPDSFLNASASPSFIFRFCWAFWIVSSFFFGRRRTTQVSLLLLIRLSVSYREPLFCCHSSSLSSVFFVVVVFLLSGQHSMPQVVHSKSLCERRPKWSRWMLILLKRSPLSKQNFTNPEARLFLFDWFPFFNAFLSSSSLRLFCDTTTSLLANGHFEDFVGGWLAFERLSRATWIDSATCLWITFCILFLLLAFILFPLRSLFCAVLLHTFCFFMLEVLFPFFFLVLLFFIIISVVSLYLCDESLVCELPPLPHPDICCISMVFISLGPGHGLWFFVGSRGGPSGTASRTSRHNSPCIARCWQNSLLWRSFCE